MGFALVSSAFSVAGLCASPSSSFRALFRLSVLPKAEAGRLPLRFGGVGNAIASTGGVPRVSEPCDEGDDRLVGKARCCGGM